MNFNEFLSEIDFNSGDYALEDGIYVLPKKIKIIDIPYSSQELGCVDNETKQEILKFINKYKETWCFANAYATEQTFILSDKPPEFQGNIIGCGFNQGSTNILDDCPKKILILFEND